MGEASARIELSAELDDCVIGSWAELLVAVTRAPLSFEAVETYLDEARALIAARQSSIALLFVLGSPKPGVDPRAQRSLIAALRDLQNSIASGTVVIRHRGPIGAAQRSIVTAITTAHRLKIPIKVVADLPQAVAWYRSHAPPRSGPTGLAGALTAFVDRWQPPR